MIPFLVKSRIGDLSVKVLNRSGEDDYFVWFDYENIFGYLSEQELIEDYIFVRLLINEGGI